MNISIFFFFDFGILKARFWDIMHEKKITDKNLQLNMFYVLNYVSRPPLLLGHPSY